jgi:hypothetical protein
MKANNHHFDRRALLASTPAVVFVTTTCGVLPGTRVMPESSATINVRVLAHWMIQRFSGPAIMAAVTPRFVVCVLIADTKEQWQLPGTDMSFAAHRVAFFAIDSITKVFAESDVIGRDFSLRIARISLDGKTVYTLGIAD